MGTSVFEGYAPNKCRASSKSDRQQQPDRAEIRVCSRGRPARRAGSNNFSSISRSRDAHHADPAADIEAPHRSRRQNVEPLSPEPERRYSGRTAGARFITERGDSACGFAWLAANGWSIVASELGYIAKNFPELTDEQRAHTGRILQTLEDQ